MTTALREALACLFTIALAAAVCILILAVTA